MLPLFSPQFYRNSYPDLAHLGDTELENHFLAFGLLERRKYFCPPPLGMPYGCCLDSYGMRYPDLVAVFKGSHELLYQHLLEFGLGEGRIYTPDMSTSENERTLLKTLYSPVTGYGSIQIQHICRSLGRPMGSLTGAGVTIGFIDSGFDASHPAYTDPIWIDPGESIGDFIDNDGDGYVDERGGWDFVNEDANPEEEYAHGTLVAGVATADRIAHGTQLTKGVAPDARIAALKVLDKSGYGSSARISKAVDFAIANHFRILNVSLSFGSAAPSVVTALAKAASAGIIVVMAAGNEGAAEPGHVARDSVSIPGVVVGAATQAGEIASFSNRAGASQNYFLAPGEDVNTTYPGGAVVQLWGTSLAAPAVSGAIALMLEASPALPVAIAIEILKRTSSNILPA